MLTAEERKKNAEIKQLIDKAYDLKYEGHNGDALVLFNEIQKKILDMNGEKSEAYASNLDDIGTCHLRGGEYTKARKLYKNAIRILESLSLTNSRLYASVHRRLRTLDAFEKAGFKCNESLKPGDDGGSVAGGDTDNGTPFFPKSEALYKVYYKINREIKGCVGRMGKAVPVWNVITGDGRVIMSEVKSTNVTRVEAECIEKKILALAPSYRDRLPRFRACYRNYTYPLVFRD